MKLTTYHYGLLSELIAMLFLLIKGYKIIAWRYKTRSGEMDIIAKKCDIVTIVEVKSRRCKLTIAQEVMTMHQIKRIKNAANIFLSRHPNYREFNIRFDLIMIKKLVILKHYQNFC